MRQTILITEDDQVQREIINDILTQSGYDVTASESAENTLDILKDQVFDLLLTDMRMPGMDGLELLRRAKRLRIFGEEREPRARTGGTRRRAFSADARGRYEE